MACKFKYGDKVKVGSHTGKIVSIIKDHIHYVCTVKFDNRFLIPPQMDYTESELELIEESKLKERKCTCGIAATYGKIPDQNHKYYCDLQKPVEEVDSTDDLLAQFEAMLGSDDDDEDDDFGFYGV